MRASPGGSAPAWRSSQSPTVWAPPLGSRDGEGALEQPGPRVSSSDCGLWSAPSWCGGLQEVSEAAGSVGHTSPDPWGPVSLRKSPRGHATAQAWTPGSPVCAAWPLPFSRTCWGGCGGLWGGPVVARAAPHVPSPASQRLCDRRARSGRVLAGRGFPAPVWGKV